MFGNFSLPELLIVGALALIVIGPKDLPRMMRSVGKFVGQARGMAREFQRSMDDAAREIDVQEFKEARALMDKKADTKSLTDTLNKKVGLDDDVRTVSKPKSPAPATKPVETASAANEAKPAEAPTEPEPAKAGQG